MSSVLKAQVRDHIADPSVAGLIIETEYEPIGGKGSPVAPPTYAREKGDPSKEPLHAASEEAFVPEHGSNGFYRDIQRTPEGAARRAQRVVLDSYGAQSGEVEGALWNNQERLGITLPGLTITGKKDAINADSPQQVELNDALDVTVSTWELAHRQADGWIKFATADGTKQVWAGSATPDGIVIKDLITQASAQNAELLYQYFPNSAIFGFWLASGVAARHRLPRAYSSEIVGYGAQPVVAGATKLDPTGGASNSTVLAIDSGGELRVLEKNSKDVQSGDPSALGLGQVPSKPVVRGYVCELILQQSSISLPVLRSLRYSNAERAEAATTVLTLLAMAGRYLSTEQGFLRSGCSLVARDEHWGWARHHSTDAVTDAFAVDSFDEVAEALREAVSDAEAVGLAFAAPIPLTFSDAERAVIAERVKTESSKQTTDLGGS